MWNRLGRSMSKNGEAPILPITTEHSSINNDVAQVPSDVQSREERAKYAGRVIYNSIHHEAGSLMPPPVAAMEPSRPPPLPLPSDGGYAHISTTEPMAVAAGKMSSVRRTFCLFVLFDLILMFILWVIYTQLIGETGFKAFEEQVKDYDFKTSLFDTVMLSAVRFTFLLLTYALFRLNHWWMIALTTALSCAMLIAKIFLFDFEGHRGSNNPLSYCLIIISFVLAWVETWFLDFKVLPAEKKMLERVNNAFTRGYGSTGIGDRIRTPRYDDMQSIITEDNQFYSPLDSPEGSDTEQDRPSSSRQASPTSLNSSALEENDYVRLARHSSEVAWTYLKSPESDWKLESGKDEVLGVVHSKKVKERGKIFRLKTVVEMPAKDLYEEMTFKPEEQPQWNSALKESRVLQVVDEHTDILYNIAAEVAGGVITSRDFVSLRTWGCRDGVYFGVGMGVNHPDMPPQKNYIRGTNGPGGWVFEPLPGDASKTLFYWFMNTDIKGWFPQKLIDANMAKVLLDFSKDLRTHVKDITGVS